MKQIDKAKIMKRNSFLFYYNWLKLLCLTMLEWKNLPEGCDADFIEKNLFENGRVNFTNHPEYGIINLAIGDNYERNVYDKPIRYKGYAGNFDYDCDFNNSVIVQNNILNFPTMPIACYFAEKISRIDRVYDVNLLGQKTPLIFQASQTEMYTLENILNDLYSNVPIIKTKNNYDINNKIQTLETQVPYLLDKLRDDKTSCMAEALTFFGIKNVNITKKERLLSDEPNANNELTELDLQMFLAKRQEAVKEINKKFGTQIEVVARKDIIQKFNETLKLLEEGENNDTV